jgi:hypothetical protein
MVSYVGSSQKVVGVDILSHVMFVFTYRKIGLQYGAEITVSYTASLRPMFWPKLQKLYSGRNFEKWGFEIAEIFDFYNFG